MSLFKTSRNLFLIALVGTASACGFQLQGALTTPAEMQRTYIATDDRRSLFYRELRTQILTSGVELVDSPARATATLSISFDATDQRVLSVSARNVPTEYEVYYTIAYSLSSGKNILLQPQELTLTRDYTYDSTLVLGKAREEELLREAIVKDLVRVVLKQIATL
jgi:LPS-assembly lipoprotein